MVCQNRRVSSGVRVTVIGTGYVGLSIALLLAPRNRVAALDIDADRIRGLRAGRSPIADPEVTAALDRNDLEVEFTVDPAAALTDAEYVVIATPTDYDDTTNSFNTGTVDDSIRLIRRLNPESTIVIKSTIPVGYTDARRREHDFDRIYFSPEFLREGHALHDNLHPSRIIVGGHSEQARGFAELLRRAAARDDVPVLLTESTEAEAIKLFANTYLAMRVAFFNELDTFAATHGLDTRQIIEGVGLDPRIGLHHNNPSFGYGGYCLPKDTKQLLASYGDIPQMLVQAIVDSNHTRMDFIADQILARRPGRVGIHRLIMKAGSDNFRESSVLAVMERLRAAGVDLMIYEPSLTAAEFDGVPVITDLDTFLEQADLIVTNRVTAELAPVMDKVYSRDVYGLD